jgi:hypothetical protein
MGAVFVSVVDLALDDDGGVTPVLDARETDRAAGGRLQPAVGAAL